MKIGFEPHRNWDITTNLCWVWVILESLCGGCDFLDLALMHENKYSSHNIKLCGSVWTISGHISPLQIILSIWNHDQYWQWNMAVENPPQMFGSNRSWTGLWESSWCWARDLGVHWHTFSTVEHPASHPRCRCFNGSVLREKWQGTMEFGEFDVEQ